MKKILSLTALCVALLAFSTTKSAAQAYENGRNYLNAGIGLGTYYSGGLGLGATFEHGFTDAISAGGLLGYSGGNYFGYRFNVLTFGVRGSYHLTELLNINNDKLDLYAGAGLNYRNYNDNYDNRGIIGYTSRSGGILPSFHVGARYMFQSNIGGFAEAGYSYASLQAGVAFKF